MGNSISTATLKSGNSLPHYVVCAVSCQVGILEKVTQTMPDSLNVAVIRNRSGLRPAHPIYLSGWVRK